MNNNTGHEIPYFWKKIYLIQTLEDTMDFHQYEEILEVLTLN
jgi:hypothetical protein